MCDVLQTKTKCILSYSKLFALREVPSYLFQACTFNTNDFIENVLVKGIVLYCPFIYNELMTVITLMTVIYV